MPLLVVIRIIALVKKKKMDVAKKSFDAFMETILEKKVNQVLS